jgi:hypothetical protein
LDQSHRHRRPRSSTWRIGRCSMPCWSVWTKARLEQHRKSLQLPQEHYEANARVSIRHLRHCVLHTHESHLCCCVLCAACLRLRLRFRFDSTRSRGRKCPHWSVHPIDPSVDSVLLLLNVSLGVDPSAFISIYNARNLASTYRESVLTLNTFVFCHPRNIQQGLLNSYFSSIFVD